MAKVFTRNFGDTNIIQVTAEDEEYPFIGATGYRDAKNHPTDDPVTCECLFYAIERIQELEAQVESLQKQKCYTI